MCEQVDSANTKVPWYRIVSADTRWISFHFGCHGNITALGSVSIELLANVGHRGGSGLTGTLSGMESGVARAENIDDVDGFLLLPLRCSCTIFNPREVTSGATL
jgi:hypothetical protein